MKQLNADYIYEQMLVNESIGEVLKGFWDWLMGKNTKKEFLITSDSFDSTKLKDVIGTSPYKVSYEPINDLPQLKVLLNDNTNPKTDKCYFELTKKLIKSFNIDDKNKDFKWYGIIYETTDEEKLKALCGVVCYFNQDNNIQTAASLINIDIHDFYKKNITTKYIEKCIDAILKEKGVRKREMILKKSWSTKGNDNENVFSTYIKNTQSYINKIKKEGTIFTVENDGDTEKLVYKKQ